MNLIDYNLPKILSEPLCELPSKEGVRWKRTLHHISDKFVAHAHFINGMNVFVEKCELCCGKLKGKEYAEQREESKKKRLEYYLEWKRNKEWNDGVGEIEEELSPEEQHLRDIAKYG